MAVRHPGAKRSRPGRKRPSGSQPRHGIRTFLAVGLDGSTRRAAAELAEQIARGPGGESVRWVRPEAYHVTLRFLGSIDPEVVPRLVESVSRETGEISPFELAIGAVHLFPNSRHPRVVALDLHPEAPLRALAEGVERAVVEAGFPPEGRSFRAHLTLGRVRGPKAPDALPEAVPSVPPFPVREVILFRSDLQPTGAVYVPLERMALGARISPGTRTSKGEPYGEE